MGQIWEKLKVTQKMNLAFGMVVVLVVAMALFSLFNVQSLGGVFDRYRDTAKESLLLANFSEDMAEARVAANRYQAEAAEEDRRAVLASLDEIINNSDKVRKMTEDPELENLILKIDDEVEEYRALFTEAAGYKQETLQLVSKLDSLGPRTRKNITQIMESAYDDNDAKSAYYAGLVQESFMLSRFYSKAFLLYGRQEDLERTLAEIDKAEKRQASLLASLQNPERRRLAKLVGESIAAFEKDLRAAGKVVARTRDLFENQLKVLGPKIAADYDTAFEDIKALQEDLSGEADVTIATSSGLTLGVGVLIALASAAFAFVIGRLVSGNVENIISQMRRLGQGEKNFTVKGAERGDEFGEMAQALDKFRQNALEAERLEEESRAVQQKQVERAEQIEQAVKSFESEIEKISKNLNDSAGSLQSMAGQLAAANEETTKQSGSVASAAEQASANVQTVASASEELSASIQEIASSVSDTAETAKSCAKAAERSQQKLDHLREAVGQIDAVIQSINDVAEQTNLLALNATIESARAGEAGKGFAVVANEVKELAGQTHKMTDEIAQKVRSIKDSANDTIEAVNEIIDRITKVDEKSASVASAVEQQNTSTMEISRNVQEAATGTDEVSRSISGIQQAAGESASSTEQLKSASDDLAERAKYLRSTVDTFLKEVRAA